MKYRIVDESTIDNLLECAYNPPTYSKDFSEEDFSEEYWKIHGFIKNALSSIGTAPIPGNYDDRDFSMNDDYIDSRGISIQLSTKKLWSRRFITTIGYCLTEASQRYSVYVDHSLPNEPDFYLFIAQDEALGFAEDESILRKFGF